MNQLEIANSIRSIIVNTAAMVIAYKWSDEFCRNELKDIRKIVESSEWFSYIDPYKFTKSDLMSLGFKLWDKESGIILIPLWILPYLKKDTQTVSINGKTYNSIEELDTDVRFGCLAYGIKLEDGENHV